MRHRVGAPLRRATVAVLAVPAAAADRSPRAGSRAFRVGLFLVLVRAVPVCAPLPDVAVHVVKAPGVRFVRAHTGGAAQSAGEIGTLPRQGIPAVGAGLRPRPGRLLPFPLRRQGVSSPPFTLGRQSVELFYEILCVVPGDVLGGEVVRVDALPLVLALSVLAEV